MTKKLTRLEKSTVILKDTKATLWCYVDTENEFKFMNQVFHIKEEVEAYKVFHKAGTVEEFTNEAYMDSILVVLNTKDQLSFYNQNYDEVESKYIEVRE